MQTDLEQGGRKRRSRVVESSPVYYGWLVLIAATIGMMMTAPGQTFGVSVFLDDIIASLGLSRSTVSLLYTIGTLVGSFSLPFIGRFIDMRGPRIAVIFISALFAAACIWMGSVSGLVTLLIGFVLIRALGQGALSLVSIHQINIWFVRKRGLAIGLNGIGIAAATAFSPLLIQFLLDQFGWRTAYPLLGILVAAIMLPVGATFYRSQPELYGLQPDGRSRKRDVEEEELVESNLTAAQARRTLTFWLFVAGDFMVNALGTGLIFHHYSIMATGGIDRLTASTFYIPLGLLSAVAVLFTGFLMDRVPPRFLLAGSQLLLVGSLLLAGNATTPLLVLVYGAALGLAQGSRSAIGGSVYAYYFGRRFVGSIKGTATTVGVAGTALGPLIYAYGFEWLGTYVPALLVTALAPLALAVTAPLLRPFRPDGTVR